ncbi:glycosyltransferase family 8 protein [Peziza echinospora]|nr:glycosyltransferase family 8 protein [Peziza echinospora]
MKEDLERLPDFDKVWTTLVTNNNYVSGLLTLDYSLKAAGSKYPLVALYTDSLPQSGLHAIRQRNIATKRIPYLSPAASYDFSNDPRFNDCWSKLASFALTEFSRVVQLDSDMLCLQNMDELMELPLDTPGLAGKGDRVFAAGHACVCNPMKKPHYPKNWIPEHCAFTSQHGRPDLAQTEGADPAVGAIGMLNSGLLVINPSEEVYSQISAYLGRSAATAMLAFAEQELLSDLYRGRWVPLPYTYNALKTMRRPGVHSEIWRDGKVKNIHYILTPKPWDEYDGGGNSTSTDETHKWWHKVNTERLAAEKAQGLDDGF